MIGMSVEKKYGFLLGVFVAYLMIATKCTKEQAIKKISELCELAEREGNHEKT
jgi:hypothetical protein